MIYIPYILAITTLAPIVRTPFMHPFMHPFSETLEKDAIKFDMFITKKNRQKSVKISTKFDISQSIIMKNTDCQNEKIIHTEHPRL